MITTFLFAAMLLVPGSLAGYHVVRGLATGTIHTKSGAFRRDRDPGGYWFYVIVFGVCSMLCFGLIIVVSGVF